ncbi:MAG: nuclease-related domain-containing protein [Wenzhouxiangellaceae bacterium]|nr:nuclease-related domain-containing protein [Wenzhouxiangellaceae bacterium]
MLAVPIALAVVWAALQVSPPLAVFAAALGAAVVFFLALPGGSSVDPGALAGIEGEVAVLKRLKTLPDDYLLLNRVQLPDDRLPNGRRELDFVVAGRGGVWVIEVKNSPGHVYVQPNERRWPLARRGCCGSRPNWNFMDNPLLQVNEQVDSLKRWLLQNGVSVQPRGVVCMSHPEVSLENVAASWVPVLVPDQLLELLVDRSAGSADRSREQMPLESRPLPQGLVRSLSELRAGQAGSAATTNPGFGARSAAS